MASSRNGSGMKILWIPGRKRHDRKGIYSATKKEVNKNYLPQRKNQVWSLGGTTEQRKLININVHDDIGSELASSSASHIVAPLVVAAGAAGADAALKPVDEKNIDEKCEDQEKIVDKEILKNGEAACNTDNIDIDVDDQAYHNAGTMRYRNKKGSNNTDFDSIDSIQHLDSDDETKKADTLEDDIDSVSMHRMRTENTSHRRRRHTTKKLKNLEKEKETNQKVVDCLYLGLMCADFPCVIS